MQDPESETSTRLFDLDNVLQVGRNLASSDCGTHKAAECQGGAA